MNVLVILEYNKDKRKEFLVSNPYGGVWYGQSSLPRASQIPENVMPKFLDTLECNYYHKYEIPMFDLIIMIL